MPFYEHTFIARQDVSPQQVDSLVEEITAIIKEHGGEVKKHEYWGLKNLAFRIKKNRKAHFSLMNIDSPHDAVAEMERQQAINDDVIRILTLKVDEHEDGPTIMMQKPSRDDKRGPRRDGPRDGPRKPFRDDKPETKAPAAETKAPAAEAPAPAKEAAKEETTS